MTESTMVVAITSLIIGIAAGLVMPHIYNVGITAAMPEITSGDLDPRDFTYTPHYVKFHVANYNGRGFAAFASDKLPVTGGRLDDEGYISLPLISTVKYSINIGDDCFYEIYPQSDYYELICPNKGVRK